MKTFAIMLAAFGAVALSEAQTLKPQIEQSNKRIEKALKEKDVASFEKIMKGEVTPNFKYVENGASMPFDKMVQGMKMGLAAMTKMTKTESVTLTVKENGKVGSSTTRHLMEGIVIGPDKKPHTMAFSGVSADSYVKVGAKWKLSKMEWVSQAMSLDGKVQPPMGMRHR